jgi:hypothetical protein
MVYFNETVVNLPLVQEDASRFSYWLRAPSNPHVSRTTNLRLATYHDETFDSTQLSGCMYGRLPYLFTKLINSLHTQTTYWFGHLR